MKKLFKMFIAVLAIGSLLVTSCKKGENDPFLSLKSRTSRLTGEWKLTSGTVKETTTTSFSTTVVTTTYTETGKTVVTTSGSSTDTDVYNYTQDITFEKTGHYESTVVETQISANGTDIPSGFQSTTTDNETGHWAFLGKNKDTDLKKKEAVAINPHESTSTTVNSLGTTTSTSSIDGWVFAAVMEIDRLKTKELVFKGTHSSTSSSSTTTTEYEYTYAIK